MVVSEIKDILRNNVDLLIDILEKLGLHDIKIKTDEIRCSLPNASNPTSVCVKLNDNLTTLVYSRNEYEGSDIISLIEYINKFNFKKSIQWLCQVMSIDYSNIQFKQSETIKFLRNFVKREREEVKHEIINEDILKKYEDRPIQKWIDEGIDIETQKKFQVRYDKNGDRIVFPIRDEGGNLISIKGRTCNPYWDELGIPKYKHYYKIIRNDILYGLNINYKNIKEKNEVIVFEAEKSVMQCDSFGVNNTVAIGTHEINAYQIEKLLKLQCDIVIAFDKELTWKEIKKEADKLSKYTNVSIIYDKNNYLINKESPSDQGFFVFYQLYQERERI